MYNEHYYDKAETIRRDALDLALQSGTPPNKVVDLAKTFENFILKGVADD